MSYTSNQVRNSFSKAPFRFHRRIMMRWLKSLFSSFEAGEFKFIANEYGQHSDESEIAIYAAAPVEFSAEEVRPAIVYQRAPFVNNNLGFGAGAMVQSAQLSQGHLQKTLLTSGNLAFHCLSKVGDEAEELAWMVYFWISECRELLTRTTRAFDYGNPVVGQVSPAPGTIVQSRNQEWMVCTCSLPVSIQYTWTSTPETQLTVERIQTDLVDEVEQTLQSIQVKEE